MSGSNFYAGERIQVTFDYAIIGGTVTTSASGTFVLHAKVPATATAGPHTIRASGSKSFAVAATTFMVS